MPSVSYVLSDTYAASGISGASVQYGTGQMFDVLAALVQGGGNSRGVGGSFTVTDSSLINSLDSSAAVKRTGTVSPTLPSAPTYGPLVFKSQGTPAPGDVVTIDSDGNWTNSSASKLPAYGGSELTFWQQRAALLDPAAYVHAVATSLNITVPTGTTWFARNMWWMQMNAQDGLFLRDAHIDSALPLPAGTTLTTSGSQVGFIYSCRPELVIGADARYRTDPKGLYYSRLQTLRTSTLQQLQVSIPSGSARNTAATANFPAWTSNNGMVMSVTLHDVSWVTLGTVPNVNLWHEVSDDHQFRGGKGGILLPFSTANFAGIKARSASVSGNVTDTSSSIGYGFVTYVQLPAGF